MKPEFSSQLSGLFEALFLISALLIFSGCGDVEEAFQKAGDHTIALTVSPDPPAAGLNTFKVRVKNAAGRPVASATVHIHYSMPAMAGMPAMANDTEARHVENGLYEAQIDLGAGGKFPWEVKVEVVESSTVLAVTQWQVTPGIKGVKSASAEGSASGPAEVDYHTCTMHPSVKEKASGTCPICAMDLVPVYQAGAEPQTGTRDKQMRTVNIPLYQQQLIGVQRDTVRLRPVVKTIRTVGHVTFNERKIAAVNLKFSGWVEKLYVNYTGQLVKQGQPLFDIYSPELVSTQEEYLLALRGASQQRRTTNSSSGNGDNRKNSLLKSVRERLLLWGISEKQMTQIEKAGAPRLKLTFYSPISGYVLEKNTLQGRHAKEGTDLYTIADLSEVWVLADIYEYELPFIKLGQEASIRLSYDPGANYTGRVDYIYPTLQARTRTAQIRLVFPNPDLKLKPDMYADVAIAVNEGKQLTIPATAVLNTGVRQLVFVDRGNGRFEPREIKLGLKFGRVYAVVAGLAAGEVVVKSGNFLIDAEAHVQGVLQTM